MICHFIFELECISPLVEKKRNRFFYSSSVFHLVSRVIHKKIFDLLLALLFHSYAGPTLSWVLKETEGRRDDVDNKNCYPASSSFYFFKFLQWKNEYEWKKQWCWWRWLVLNKLEMGTVGRTLMETVDVWKNKQEWNGMLLLPLLLNRRAWHFFDPVTILILILWYPAKEFFSSWTRMGEDKWMNCDI